MDDSEIISLFWQRDEKAIKHTADKYGAYCENIALNVLGNRTDAEECVNDTYLRVWNSIPPERPSSLCAFIGTVVRNISIDAYRKKYSAKNKASEFCVSLDELGDTLTDESDTASMNENETGALISRFLSLENEQNRRVFVCRYYYFDSVEDIAKRHRMSQSKVKSILFRMRKRLKAFLEKEGLKP